MAQVAPQAVPKTPKWNISLDPKKYVNSAAISGDSTKVVAGTFYHAYKPADSLAKTLPAPPGPDQFGTYCFNSDGKQLWVDQFTGWEGVYAVAISDDGTVAASGGWYSHNPWRGFIRAYAASDGKLLLNNLIGARVNQLALSANGATLVAAADNLYLFQQANGVFPKTPAVFKLSGTKNSVQSVAISGDGRAIVIGDELGYVYLVENNKGRFGNIFRWSDPSLTVVHGVAMAAEGGFFAAVGSSQLAYLFTPVTIQSGKPYATYDFGSVARAGWVAIDAAGDFVSVVRNYQQTGFVYGLENANQSLKLRWNNPQSTLANPNSTTVDAKGEYITVADGYPDNTPGHFYLFAASTGDALWQYQTKNMNWPMGISSNGTGIVAGSDLGSVYYFTPD